MKTQIKSAVAFIAFTSLSFLPSSGFAQLQNKPSLAQAELVYKRKLIHFTRAWNETSAIEKALVLNADLLGNQETRIFNDNVIKLLARHAHQSVSSNADYAQLVYNLGIVTRDGRTYWVKNCKISLGSNLLLSADDGLTLNTFLDPGVEFDSGSVELTSVVDQKNMFFGKLRNLWWQQISAKSHVDEIASE